MHPDGAAVGKIVRAALQKEGRWDELAKRTTVFMGTVNEVATGVKLGSTDAGFVWDVLAGQFDLEVVTVPELSGLRAQVTASVLKSSAQKEVALAFARYLAVPNKGAATFSSFGYLPVSDQHR